MVGLNQLQYEQKNSVGTPFLCIINIVAWDKCPSSAFKPSSFFFWRQSSIHQDVEKCSLGTRALCPVMSNRNTKLLEGVKDQCLSTACFMRTLAPEEKKVIQTVEICPLCMFSNMVTMVYFFSQLPEYKLNPIAIGSIQTCAKRVHMITILIFTVKRSVLICFHKQKWYTVFPPLNADL